MTSDELADRVGNFIVEAVTRVTGTGHEQYDKEGTQNFEVMDLDQLFEWAREELYDIVNYSVMLSIRLDRLQGELATTIKEAANAAK